jgi:hypothetical protein
MLTLNQEDLKELNNFLQELPLKYGLPLLNFINGKITEQNKTAPEVPVEQLED